MWQPPSKFEESRSDGNDMNGEALFEYPWFEHYFTEEGREAYLIYNSSRYRLIERER